MPLTPDSTAKDAPADTAANKIDGIEIGQISIEEESDEDSTINIGDYAKSGFRAKKPWFDKGIDVYNAPEKGPILAYVTFQNRDKDGHAHFDIAVSDTNKNKLTLTYLADAVYPAFNRQGTEVVFVRREPHSTRFVLSKVPFTANFDEYTSEDPIDIFVPDAKYRYYNIYSPKYSPDGMRLAFSFFDDVQFAAALAWALSFWICVAAIESAVVLESAQLFHTVSATWMVLSRREMFTVVSFTIATVAYGSL